MGCLHSFWGVLGCHWCGLLGKCENNETLLFSMCFEHCGWMDDGWLNKLVAAWIFRCNCLIYPSILAAIHLSAFHVRIYPLIDRSCESMHPYSKTIWTICGWMEWISHLSSTDPFWPPDIQICVYIKNNKKKNIYIYIYILYIYKSVWSTFSFVDVWAGCSH